MTLNQATTEAAPQPPDPHEHRDLKEQENIFRANMASVAGAASMFVATLLVSLLIPIFPVSVAILLSIVVGVLA